MGQCLITRRGGKTSVNTDLPALDNNYPQDVTIWGGEANASFKVVISRAGTDTNYAYQWFKDGAVVGTAATYSETTPTDYGSHTIQCVITTSQGIISSRIATYIIKNPNFLYSYTGNVITGSNNTFYLTTSGTLNITNYGKNEDGMFDIFLLGGGGGGAITGLGGGGYYTTTSKKKLEKNTNYQFIIGAGGAAGSLTAAGGNGGSTTTTISNINEGAGGKAGNKVEAYISCTCQSPNGTAGNIYEYRYGYNQDTGVYTITNRSSVGSGGLTLNLLYPLKQVSALYNGSAINVYLAPNKIAYWCYITEQKAISSNNATAGAGGSITYVFGSNSNLQVSGPGVFNSNAALRYGQGGNNNILAGKNGLAVIRFSS